MSKKNFISESFRQRADGAAFFEAWVGAKLSRSNLFTCHHPFTLAADTGNPLSFYAHSWDLDVSPDNKVFHPAEVKSVNLKFTEPNDYPHLGVLVCSRESWDKKWPGASHTKRDFLIVSRLTGGIIWLPTGVEVGTTMVVEKIRKEIYPCVTVHKGELRSLSDYVAHIQSHAEPWGEPNGEED